MKTKFLISLMTSISMLLLISCGGKVFKLTNEQMDEMIKNEIPIGSTKSQVVTFVDSLKMGSLKAINHGYEDGNPWGTDRLERNQSKVQGHLVAEIRNVGRDPSQFQVYHMRIVFYFGEGERLLDYKIETRGDW